MPKTDVRIRLAHSPDSDDLVMWWPLVGPDRSGEPVIDTGPFRFELAAEDVEQLNQSAVGGASEYDVTAISAAAYPAIRERYAITASGGSFGEGYGPRVVVRRDADVRTPGDLRGTRIAVPGINTSAFLTLTLLLEGNAEDRGFEPVPMLFSEIPDAVARGDADAGLLIHEAQLTFEALGLRKLVDLGEWWSSQQSLPLPLGLNVVRRDLDQRFGEGTVRALAGVLSASVHHAVEHKAESKAYLRANRGDRTEWDDDALVEKYLSMYVSDLTLDMGATGRRALAALLGTGHARGLCADPGTIDVV